MPSLFAAREISHSAFMNILRSGLKKAVLLPVAVKGAHRRQKRAPVGARPLLEKA
jgi:hypothetical protein